MGSHGNTFNGKEMVQRLRIKEHVEELECLRVPSYLNKFIHSIQ